MANLSQTTKDQRAFVAGRFVLEFDGAKDNQLNMLISADGANFKSESIGEKVGAQGLETRYPGRQKFEDITLTVGTAMSPVFWDWIQKSVDNNYIRKSGAIVTYDFDGKERTRRAFYDALIAEIQFPTCDAKSKTPAFVTVKITPERMEYKVGGGDTSKPGDPTKQKMWISSNFRFRIDGFTDMQWVQKVEAFSIKQNIIDNPVGRELYIRKEVGRVDYPNLTFYVPETYAKPWLEYWKKFVGDGEHLGTNEHTGSLEYLNSDLTKTLMTVKFQGIGITGCTWDKHDAGVEQVRMLKVDCYCESLSFQPGSGNRVFRRR